MDIWVAGRLCGKYRDEKNRGIWEILGVFEDRDLARARCNGPLSAEDETGDFVGKVVLNEGLPDELVPWPEFYWVKDGQLLDLQGNIVEAA
jgi:hypothetical protein